ncbi:MAG: hypothetical protein BM564_09330 [Bacteroidetes bacterium MedPE-SWsnd-G2]|nr:MAG: hypothetical protein BM564_09330 [Bacteroidetes bacterium MedPE-SWsnd-G2]
MVTGLKITQTSNKLNTNSIKELSIQISLNGLSFCVLNRSTHTIEFLISEHFDKKLPPFALLEKLKAAFSLYAELQDDFNSVLIIYQNELSTLVPKELFDKDTIADYLKFNSKILKSDYISFDEIAINSSVNVFVPLVNINNYIFENFGSFKYKHASSILVDSILQSNYSSKEEKVVLNLSSGYFEMIALNEGKLQLYNSFEFDTKEDFIYYVLFTMEQLKMSPEQVEVVLSGEIDETSELYQIAYHYIRNVSFIKPGYTFAFEEQSKPSLVHQDYLILNSF